MKTELRTFSFAALTLMLGCGSCQMAVAQSAPAKHAAAKQDIVTQTLKLLQAKVPESMIIKKIQAANTPVSPTTDQLVALKQAGASDAILSLLEDPKGGAPAADASTVTPAATPAAAAAAPPPPPPPPPPAAPQTPDKKRVAVDEFDFSTVRTAVAEIFGTQQNIGKGIQSMFLTRISKDGKVVVVERQKIDKIMAEQDFAAGGRVKKGTGAKVGNIRGADAILYGDVVIFGRDDGRKGVAVGGAGGGILGGAIAGISRAKKTDKAVVAIDYRLVDAETSEVIATGEARGESARKSSSMSVLAGAFGVGGGGAGGAQIDMTSSNFEETIIGEATMDCVNKLAIALEEQIPNLQAKHVDVSARVAFVSGSQVTINAGTAQGVVLGDRFEIAHILSEVKDPTTGEVIDLATQKIGTLDIIQVKERVSIGTYTGTAGVKAGDVAEKH